MKKIVALVSVIMMMFSMVFSANAASYSQAGNVKTPTAIYYKDLVRFVEVASAVQGKTANIVNATRYNGSSTVWAVRLSFGDGDMTDYILNVYPYANDPITHEVTTLPFKNKEDGTSKFGPNWYYFGLFDDVTHDSCGFVIAERIKRWPAWADLTFSGATHRGVYYTGSYTEASSEGFMEAHINQ